MASPNPFSSSPYAQLAAEQEELARVQPPAPAAPAAMPDVTSAQPTPAAAQPAQPEEAPAPRHRGSDGYMPPADLRPVFNASAEAFGVPVNALMALAHQESRYNPNAVGSETQWGRAKGIMQYLDGTAQGLGINPFDPAEAIPAAAKQLRERLDQGYSLEDAVKEHFAGPDRKKWGVKTAAYGQEVMAKVGRIGDVLMGEPASASAGPDLAALQQQLDTEEPGRYKVMPEGYDQTHFTTAMPRDVYQQTFQQTNPGASEAAVKYAMDQYDAQAQQRAAQTPVADRFKTLQSPEATFDARLNQKLQGAPNGVVPPLPGELHPQPPAPAQAPAESGLMGDIGDIGRNLKIGANVAAQDVRELASRIPVIGKPLVRGADVVDQYFSGKPSEQLLADDTKQMTQAMTPETQAAMAKKWWDSDKGTFGAAWSDPRSYLTGVIQSLPEQVLTMGPSLSLAKAAYAAKIAVGTEAAIASQAAARTAMVAGAISDGALGGAQSARDVREKVTTLPQSTLNQSEAYQALIASGMDPSAARKALAEDIATRAFVTSGIVTGLFGGMGDRAIAKIFTEQVGKSVVSNAIKGFGKGALAEGLFEELPQSAGQQLAQNAAMRSADPNQSLSEDVVNQGLGGAVLGGLQGGGMGAVAGAVNPHTAEQPAPAAEAPAAAPRPVPASQVQPVPASAVPAAPSATPLTSAVENAAEQPQRVVVTNAEGTSATGTVQRYEETKDGGFEAEIVGDDGQVYTITDEDGVQLTPVANEPGPLTAAVEAAAEHHEVAPTAPDEQAHAEIAEAQQAAQPEAEQETVAPAEPEPAPAPRAEPPTVADMSDAQLRERMQYIASQAKDSGWDKRFVAARREVEAEINRRAKAQEAGNAPQVSDTGGNVGRGSDRTVAPDGTAVDGRPGADRPLPGYGRTDAGLDAGQAAADRPAASAAADTKPALKDKHAKQIFSAEDKARAYIAKQKIGATHRVEQTGRVRYEIRPKAKPATVDHLAQRQQQDAALEAQIAVANANASARKTANGESAAPSKDVIVDEELMQAAEAETSALDNWRIQNDMHNDQQGVIPGKPTSINAALKKGQYTVDDIASGWSKTRDLLRKRYGDYVTLYRADAPESKWHADTSVVYMGDEKLAQHFRRTDRPVKPYTVAVDDVLGMNVQKNGYYEFIVKRPGEKMPPKAAEAALAAEKVPEVAPEPAAPAKREVRDTRDSGVRFHGTSNELPGGKPNNDYAMSGDSRNIYGQGFYTTDAADISHGYMKKGRGGSPTLYEIGERGKVKLYDMEAPLTPAIHKMLDETMGDVPTHNDDTGEPLTNLREVFDEYRANSQGEGLTRNDVQEVFDSIRYNLEQQGYRGYQHTGGLKTKNQPHEVRIYWSPEDDIDVTKSDIAKYAADQQAAPGVPEATAGGSQLAPVAEPAQESAAPEADSIDHIPLTFRKKFKVPHEVWVEDEKQYHTVDMPAHKALASVREDIGNLRALLGCLRG